jgi:DNA-binding CsgD family transcriptional regulator/tetratricopeptide (TPR) repeat protein
LVVRGEAGIGKTALLAYAVEQASDMTVITVTGVEGESDLAFGGLHGLLSPIVDALDGVPGPQREALAAALGLSAGEGRDRLLVSAGVLSLLAAAAEPKPILCVVDDAQWLDVPSANALSFTARRLVAEDVVILFGARDGDLRRFEAAGLEELEVGGLERDVATMVLNQVAREAAPSVRGRLLDEAAGNPLALLELPAGLSDAQLAGHARLPEALPVTERLRAAFGQRIERLPEPTRAALLIAAAEVAGELAIILRAAAELGLPPDAFDPAEEAGLVRTAGALSFRHPLVRSVIYESMPLGRRRRAHTALAAALEHEHQGERAIWHRAMATSTTDEDVADALEASGRRSQLRGGHASAATAFERAATLSKATPPRARRLAAAVEAAWFAAQVDRALELVSRSLPLSEPAQRAGLLYWRGAIEGQSGGLLDGVATLHQAAALSEDPSLTLKILRDGCAMADQAGAPDEALSFAERAADATCAGEIDRFTKASLTARAADLSGDYARGKALAAELVELAERIDVPVCLIWSTLAAIRAGMGEASLRHASRAVSRARDTGEVTTLPFCLHVQAMALIGHSRFDLAYATAEEGWRLALETGQPWAAGWNVTYLALIDALRGSEQRVQAHVAELQALVARSGATSTVHYAERVLGLLDLGLGRPADATDRLLRAFSIGRRDSDPSFVSDVPDAIEAAARSDRLPEVAGHLARFEEWAQSSCDPKALALLARCRALVDEQHAEEHYEHAVALAHSLPPFDQARTELLYGEWLRRQRRRVDARRHLRTALELFGRMGVSPWESRAQAELRASGETARKRDPTTRDLLTPQELQISRLVASGMTNPEVAAKLFLSPRTVDYHLRKVFTKLGIVSRAELSRVDLGDSVAA